MLEARVDRLEAALQRLAESLERLAAHLERLTLRVDRVEQHLAWLSGDALERRGLRHDQDVGTYLLAEVSWVVDKGDVERAARRAALYERAVGLPVIPAVAGEQILPDAESEAKAARVWCVLDGRAEPPPS